MCHTVAICQIFPSIGFEPSFMIPYSRKVCWIHTFRVFGRKSLANGSAKGLFVTTTLVWLFADDLPNSSNYLPTKLFRYTVYSLAHWELDSLHFTSHCMLLLFYHHYRITHIDQRLCSITKAFNEKWKHSQQSLHSENTLSIWNYWHLVSSQTKSSSPPVEVKSKNSPFKRSNSLPGRFRFNKHMTVHESSSHPIPPTELKKSIMVNSCITWWKYLEKVRTSCIST